MLTVGVLLLVSCFILVVCCFAQFVLSFTSAACLLFFHYLVYLLSASSLILCDVLPQC